MKEDFCLRILFPTWCNNGNRYSRVILYILKIVINDFKKFNFLDIQSRTRRFKFSIYDYFQFIIFHFSVEFLQNWLLEFKSVLNFYLSPLALSKVWAFHIIRQLFFLKKVSVFLVSKTRVFLEYFVRLHTLWT